MLQLPCQQPMARPLRRWCRCPPLYRHPWRSLPSLRFRHLSHRRPSQVNFFQQICAAGRGCLAHVMRKPPNCSPLHAVTPPSPASPAVTREPVAVPAYYSAASPSPSPAMLRNSPGAVLLLSVLPPAAGRRMPPCWAAYIVHGPAAPQPHLCGSLATLEPPSSCACRARGLQSGPALAACGVCSASAALAHPCPCNIHTAPARGLFSHACACAPRTRPGPALLPYVTCPAACGPTCILRLPQHPIAAVQSCRSGCSHGGLRAAPPFPPSPTSQRSSASTHGRSCPVMPPTAVLSPSPFEMRSSPPPPSSLGSAAVVPYYSPAGGLVEAGDATSSMQRF